MTNEPEKPPETYPEIEGTKTGYYSDNSHLRFVCCMLFLVFGGIISVVVVMYLLDKIF